MSAPSSARGPSDVLIGRDDHPDLVEHGCLDFIGAVIRFYGWFGDARGVYIIIFIGAMGFAATQLIVGILGIVVLFQRQRQQRQGRKLR